MTSKKPSYLTLENEGVFNGSGTTNLYHVTNQRGELVAVIRYNVPWRKYCMFPQPHMMLDSACIQEILGFLRQVNDEHKKQCAERRAKKLGD